MMPFHFHGELVHDVVHNALIAIVWLADQLPFISHATVTMANRLQGARR